LRTAHFGATVLGATENTGSKWPAQHRGHGRGCNSEIGVDDEAVGA